MKDSFLGTLAAIFTAALIAIPGGWAFYTVIKPLICGITAHCGAASW